MSLRDKMLLLFLCSLPFFRVDFSARLLDFKLTPFFLSSLLLLIFFSTDVLYSFSKGRRIYINSSLKVFIQLSCTCVFVFVLSIFPFDDYVQIKRGVLFFLVVVTSWISIYYLNISKNKELICVKFVKFSIFSYLVFSCIQLFFFLQGQHYLTGTNPSEVFRLLPQTIGPWLPRFTGPMTDPNVAGYYCLFLYLMLKYYGIKMKKVNFLLVIFILLTLSRSAIATLILIKVFIVAMGMLKKQGMRVSVRKLKLGLFMFSTVTVLSVLAITWSINTSPNIESNWIVKGLKARFVDKGSTSKHTSLIEIAIDETISSVSTFSLGHGFGSSYKYTGSFFGEGNKYGNFHSEFLTIFFETGIVGLLCYVTLFIVPLFILIFIKTNMNKVYLGAMIVTMLLESLFYQQYIFYYYWFFLAFVWSNLPRLKFGYE